MDVLQAAVGWDAPKARNQSPEMSFEFAWLETQSAVGGLDRSELVEVQ